MATRGRGRTGTDARGGRDASGRSREDRGQAPASAARPPDNRRAGPGTAAAGLPRSYSAGQTPPAPRPPGRSAPRSTRADTPGGHARGSSPPPRDGTRAARPPSVHASDEIPFGGLLPESLREVLLAPV